MLGRLSNDVDRFARRHGLRRGVEAAAVLKAAREVVSTVLPEQLAPHVTPVGFRDGTLTLQAPDGVTLASVAAYRGALLDAFTAKFGRSVVLRVVVKPVRAEEVPVPIDQADLGPV